MRGYVARKKTGKGGAGKIRYYPVVELPPDPKTKKRRRQWHRGYDRKKDAEAALATLVSSVGDNTYVEPSKKTVAEFVAEWLPGLRDLKQSTLSSYRSTLETHVVPRIGGIPVQKLGAADLNAMYADLARNGRARGPGGLSPTTVRYVHVVLKRCLNDAVAQGVVVRNPAGLVKAPKGSGRAKDLVERAWAPEQVRTFLEHVADDRLAGLWLLAATTGMRRGELLGLRWQDVDFEAGRLRISQALVTRGHYADVAIQTPKTDASTRTVSIDPATVAGLRRHRTRQAEERLAFGPDWSDTGLVFTAPDGRWIHPATLSRTFDREVKAAGLPRIRFHDLRHTYATTALAAGVAVKIVSERLGHSNISITLDTYSHVLPRMDEQAANAIASLILGSASAEG